MASYRLHETMREYAGLKLREAAEEDILDESYVEYYRTRCRDAEADARHRPVEWLHWETVELWLAANPGDADAAEIRNRHERAKWNYLRHQRDCLGWAIFVGRKQP